MKKKNIITIFMFLLLISVDQMSKILITSNIKLYESINIIPNFFRLTYSKNFGAAFGILEGKRYLFIMFSIIALIFLIYELLYKKNNKLYHYSLILIISGIVGNFIDRLFYGFVRDFFDFTLFGYETAIFNLADSFIVIGVILFIMSLIMEEKNENKKRMDK